ncbi:MAG: hypothetical protein ACI8V2_005429 [Candidatus Latescibacterota bacterium]|jgi:hypothetical protein
MAQVKGRSSAIPITLADGRALFCSLFWGGIQRVRVCCMLYSVFCLLPLGCAYYSTSATGSGGIRTVAIPLFENESLEANIHQALTDSLTQGFVTDGALRVVDEDLADAILQGTVVEVKEEPFTYSNQADQYQISVFVKVVFYDTREKKVIWEAERMRGYGIYSAVGSREENRQEGLNAAIQLLTRDVVDRTQVGGW